MAGTVADKWTDERQDAAPNLLGALMRHWRKARGVSQFDLAIAAGTSQRHVSFLESGRSKASRTMILALAEALDLPLRARNEILAAAGFAAYYPERSLAAAELAQAAAMLGRILDHHEPYPALVLDGGWNILKLNAAAARLLALLSPKAADGHGVQGVNFLRLMCDPDGMKPHIVSWAHTGPALLARLRREAAACPGAAAERLLRELLAKNAFPPFVGADEGPLDANIPVEFKLGDRSVRLVNTLTTFGTPQDVALQELRIEMSFPADPESERILRRLAGDG